MTKDTLIACIRDYLTCLNARDWAGLQNFVDDDLHYNGERIGIASYRRKLKDDILDIPDLHFQAQRLLVDPPCIACRFEFTCRPRGEFLQLPIDGREITFAEHVIYEFQQDKIRSVWSIVDRAAIERQLRHQSHSPVTERKLLSDADFDT